MFPAASAVLGAVKALRHGVGLLASIDAYPRDDALFNAGMSAKAPSLLDVGKELTSVAAGARQARGMIPGASR